MSIDSKPVSLIDLLRLRVTQMPRSPDPCRRQTQPITLPLVVHANMGQYETVGNCMTKDMHAKGIYAHLTVLVQTKGTHLWSGMPEHQL